MSRATEERPALGEERIPSGEEEAISKIVKAEQTLLQHRIGAEKLPPKGRPVPRGQHPKHHGCVRGEFVIVDSIPTEHRVGIFREPGRRLACWIRFSNARSHDDRESGGHGMAIKVMNVRGGEAAGPEHRSVNQDFLLLDHPVFFIKDAIEYARLEEALVKKEIGKGWFSNLSVLSYFLARPSELAILNRIRNNLPTNPLSETYWSTTPYRFGQENAVKYMARPQGNDAPIGAERSSADQLREAMARHLQLRGAAFDFFVQLQADPHDQPIEDPTVEWDERAAPYMKVATIQIEPRQPFDSEASMAFCENLSFTPWRGLAEHKPIGGINRVRERVYEALSEMRHRLNGVLEHEPTPETSPEG